MKNWTKVMIAGAMLAASGAANAQFSATVTGASDYDFRGITQTALDPALQLSLDYSFGESGFAIGAWGSNVDFGDSTDMEIDYYLTYTKELENGFFWELGYTHYTYDSDFNVDYGEAKFGIGYGGLSAAVWFAEDYGNTGESAFYTEVNYSHALPWELSLDLHVGRSSGDYWSTVDYNDWSIGLSRSFGHFDVGLKYVNGTDLGANDTPDDILTSKDKVLLTVSTTFPWGD